MKLPRLKKNLEFVILISIPLLIVVSTVVIIVSMLYLFKGEEGIGAAYISDTFDNEDYLDGGNSSNYLVTGGQVKVSAASYNFGTGDDGACTVSADTDINTGTCVGRANGDAVNFSSTANTSAGSNTIVLSSTPTGLAVDDEVLIINLQGTSENYSDVGEYETAYITEINSNTLTLDSNLVNGYDGTTQKIMVQRVPQYTSVTVNADKNFYPSDWDGTKGGVLAFKATGTVTVTGTIHADSKGFLLGTGAPPSSATRPTGGESPFGSGGSGGCNAFTNCMIGEDGTAGGGGGGSSLSGFNAGVGGSGSASLGGGGGGGGSAYGTCGCYGGGGGGGGYGSAGDGGDGERSYGTSGVASNSGDGGDGAYWGAGNCGGSGGGGGGGGTYGQGSLDTLFLGSGGGGGGSMAGGYTGMNGGDGGGVVIILGDTIDIDGAVSSSGEVGVNSGVGKGSGGGGGSGGSVLIQADVVDVGASKIEASGGFGGCCDDTWGQAGGDGGHGRVRVKYATSLSGTVSANFKAMSSDSGIYGSSGTYSTARSTASSHYPTSQTSVLGQQYCNPGTYYIYRDFTKFDTSSIPNDATITQVNLKLTPVYQLSGNNVKFDVQIVKADWSAYEPITSGNRDSVFDLALSEDLDNSIWRNTDGLVLNTTYTSGNLDTSWVNKSGSTYYALVSKNDRDNTAPGYGLANYQYIYPATADHVTSSYSSVLQVEYSGLQLPGYGDSGTIQSVDLISGDNSAGIQSFVYNLSAKPGSTTATVQFSTDGSNWYNSSGVLGGTDTLSTGVDNTIDLSGLSWETPTFYYKVAFGTDGGTATPVLDDITVNYESAPGVPTIGVPTVLSPTSIRWNFTDNATNEAGFKLFDGEDNLIDTDEIQDLTYMDEAGLSANTQYSRKAASYNYLGDSGFSSTATVYTLANTPTLTAGDISVSTIALDAGNTANLASDSSGLYFDCTGEGCDSGVNEWIQTASDTATGLSANTQYTFQTKARNGDSVETNNSSELSKYTLANTPTISLGDLTTSSIELDAGNTVNISSDSSGLYFDCTSAGCDTGINSWLQTTEDVATGLSPNTQYTFQIKARNGDSTETSYSDTQSVYTHANVPGTPAKADSTPRILDVTLDVNSNPSSTDFVLQETSTGKYVNKDSGLLQVAPDWGTYSEFVSGGVARVTSLSAGTTYQFKMKARNGDNIETTFGASIAAKTKVIITNIPESLSVNLRGNPTTNLTTDGVDSNSYDLRVKKDNVWIAEIPIDLTENRDFSDIVALADDENSKAVVKFTASHGFTETYDMYIMKGDTDYVRVCPSSLTLAQVTMACTNGVDFNGPYPQVKNVAGTSVTVRSGSVGEVAYWKVEDLEGTGAMGVVTSVEEQEEEEGEEDEADDTTDEEEEFIEDGQEEEEEEEKETEINRPSLIYPESGEQNELQKVVATVYEAATRAISTAVREIEDFAEENENVAGTIVLVPAATSATAIAVTGGATLTDIPYRIMQFILGLLQSVGVVKGKKKYKPWGVVYNSVTKEPVSSAVVRLFSGGLLISTEVTDIKGVFAFSPKKGTYEMKVSKARYIFPSELVTGKTDLLRNYIYRGDKYKVAKDKQDLSVNIPVDPQEVSPSVSYLSLVGMYLATIIVALNPIFILVGITMSSALYSLTGKVLNLVIIGVYLLILLFQLIDSIRRRTGWGIVRDDKGKRLGGVKVGIYDKKYNKLIDVRVTDNKGRFRFILPEDEYVIKPYKSKYGLTGKQRSGVKIRKKGEGVFLVVANITVKK